MTEHEHLDPDAVKDNHINDENQEPGTAKAYVKQELERIKDFVLNSLSIDDLKSGEWLIQLIAFSLKQYKDEVDASYFKKKYPHLPPDAVVDARIELASNYAAIEGGLSSAAYTSAVVATIGTGGAASPLTLPMGGASLVLDLVYISHLQLRMAHDIAVLYGVEFDLNDPEDMWNFIKIAFGIKAGETLGSGVLKGTPAVLRPAIKKIFSGSTLRAVQTLPVIGRHLLQRNIIKFAIPGVTIPVTIMLNRWITRTSGFYAKRMLRKEAQIIEASRRMAARGDNTEALLSTVWWVIKHEKQTQSDGRLFLHHLTVASRDNFSNGGENMVDLDKFSAQIEIDEHDLKECLSNVSEEYAPHLYEAAIIAAAVDGPITKKKHALLKSLAEKLQVPPNSELINAIERQWK